MKTLRNILLALAALAAAGSWAATSVIIKYNNDGTISTQTTINPGSAPAPVQGSPITSMRPNKWFINNSKIPKGLQGINYDDSAPFPSIFVHGSDTPVLGPGTLRPGNCNQPWTGAYGINGADFVGSMTSGVLNVTSMIGGTINTTGFMYLQNLGNLTASARITAQLSGTPGGVGTYQTGGTISIGSITWNGRTNACQRNAGNFRATIAFAKMDYADPIVLPAQPNKSHLHTFFGNTSVDAWSTNDGGPHSITNHGNSTSAGGTLNRSAYWIPAQIYHCPTTFHDNGCDYSQDGTPIVPSAFLVYYKGAHGFGSFINDGNFDNAWTATNDVQAFPQGFKMLAGNPAATGPGNDLRYICRSATQIDVNAADHIPGTGSGATDICTEAQAAAVGSSLLNGGYMREIVGFPSCWNGIDIDSPTHNSHVHYYPGGDGTPCPSGWDKQIIGIEYQIDFYFTMLGHDPVTLKGVADMKYWRLASDNYPDTQPAGYSGHGDWFHGWQQAVMDRWVQDCVRRGSDCQVNIVGADPTNTTDPITIFRLMGSQRTDK